MKKKTYTAQFRADAVHRMETAPSISELARELKVRPNMLYAWRKRLLASGTVPKRKNAKVQDVSHDAIIYLRHAKDAMNKALREGKLKQLDKAHLLALLALQTLTGE